MNSLKNNKLGIYNDKELSNIEYILFNNKYHLINEAYTFNCESIFSTDYFINKVIDSIKIKKYV